MSCPPWARFRPRKTRRENAAKPPQKWLGSEVWSKKGRRTNGQKFREKARWPCQNGRISACFWCQHYCTGGKEAISLNQSVNFRWGETQAQRVVPPSLALTASRDCLPINGLGFKPALFPDMAPLISANCYESGETPVKKGGGGLCGSALEQGKGGGGATGLEGRKNP